MAADWLSYLDVIGIRPISLGSLVLLFLSIVLVLEDRRESGCEILIGIICNLSVMLNSFYL